MIKFTAINKQHAEIAQKQVEALGLKAKVVGRSVLVAHDWNQPDSGQQERIIGIMTQAMAHTETPNEWDIQYMNEGKNEN